MRIGIPRPECVCGHELRMGFKVCPNCGRPTKEVIKLWNRKNLEKWNSFCIGKSENTAEEKHAFPSLEQNGANSTENSLNPNNSTQTNNCVARRLNSKPYQVKIISSKEQIIKLLQEDWELVGEISKGEFVMRKPNGSFSGC